MSKRCYATSICLFCLKRTQEKKSTKMSITDIGCGLTRRVNRVYFSETWLKILNNLAWLKVGYNKITGLHFMSGRTEMGYEVG